MTTSLDGGGGKDSPDVIRHLVLLGDALANIDLGTGSAEEALVPRPRNAWKLTVLDAAQALRRGPLRVIPDDATHVVVSVEGGWAIQASGLLQSGARTIRDALGTLATSADVFEDVFAQLVQSALEAALPAVVCTLVPSRFDQPEDQRIAAAALAIFNDRIVRRAFAAHFPIVDLRLVCDENADYATETLLSRSGVRKAANVIRAALYDVSREARRTRVYF